jgi:hypothetical protein
MDRLGKALGKVENVLRDCDVDARQYCKETVAGSCLLLFGCPTGDVTPMQGHGFQHLG